MSDRPEVPAGHHPAAFSELEKEDGFALFADEFGTECSIIKYERVPGAFLITKYITADDDSAAAQDLSGRSTEDVDISEILKRLAGAS